MPGAIGYRSAVFIGASSMMGIPSGDVQDEILVLRRTRLRHTERLDRTAGADDILIAAGGAAALNRAGICVLRAC